MLAFAADSGSFSALRGERVGVPCVGVAPAQVGLHPARQRRMVRMIRGAHREGAHRPELGLDRVGPRGVGRGPTQLDLVACRPGPDGWGLVRRQVVHDHVDRWAIGSRGADRLERRQRVIAALAPAGDAPQLIIAEDESSRGSSGWRACGDTSPATGSASTRVPRSSRDTAGSTAARTGRTRNPASGSGWSGTRCGRAWRPCPGRWTPSTSGSAGVSASIRRAMAR
jgi:hypothetical protein